MALYSRFVVVLLYGWSYLCIGYCAMLKTDNFPAGRKVDFTHSVDKKQPTKEDQDLLLQDTMTEHMQMLYAKYNRAGFPFKDGNTVRSFKAHWGTLNKKQLQIFNLTSLTKSEDVLSATLHYYIGDLQNGTQGCSRTKSCSRHGPRRHSHIHMVIWSFASVDNKMRTLGQFRINVSTLYRDFISWQWKDITRVVNQAKHHDELLIGIDVASQGPQPWKKLLSDRSPYILVYANDSAISEPESVVATLQRHPLVGGEDSISHSFHKLGLRERNNTEQQQQQQQQQPTDSHRLSSTDMCSPHYSSLSGPTEGSLTMATQNWTGFSSPSLENFPPVPSQLVTCPPRLENLSCASPSAGKTRDLEPISYVTLQEQRCILSWFQGWTASQRERFLQDLLGKAVPGKVCTLLDSLSTLQVKDRLPNIFECQLRLWTQWFETWGEEERNHFLHVLEEQDPTFVAHFYRSVAGTAGRD